ncbi:hypothetical protein D4764_08G0001590 [Takifugu flavidus]|uniref:Uncharacterized protein n=1 Tax=Takifugu flavidus TaxID=433684 RepID=A0A5C6MLX6_9TELE|nr:hypothetical protein D4764_08G0001590 [Takifugu flavidus]
MVPETRDEIINNLIETVWKYVQDEEFYIRRDVFKNIKKTFRKSLYKKTTVSPSAWRYLMVIILHIHNLRKRHYLTEAGFWSNEPETPGNRCSITLF